MDWQAIEDLNITLYKNEKQTFTIHGLSQSYLAESKGFNKNQTSNLKKNDSKLGNNHAVTFQLETVA